jgi:hypothetical protein
MADSLNRLLPPWGHAGARRVTTGLKKRKAPAWIRVLTWALCESG